MEYGMKLMLWLVFFGSLQIFAVLIAIIYHFFEWITDKKFKWMYPISNITSDFGILGVVIILILLMIEVHC